MSSMQPSRLTLALLAAGLACSSAAIAGENFSTLFTEAKPILDMRYRYEHVDQDDSRFDHANAQTLRTRVGVQSGKWYGLSALVEVDNVSRLGKAAYNNTRNGQGNAVGGYSTVADPDGSEINQALLRYDHAQGSAVFGRQRINLDNQRFVGGVGWRQNEQTYDGVLGQLKPLDGLTLTYAYIDNINTIFGPGDNRFDNVTNPANIEGHSHLLNAQYVVSPALTVTAYNYLLGLDNIANANNAAMLGNLSSKTYGTRLNGAVQGVSYVLEYARQQDYADNPLDLSSEYYLAELGYTLSGVALKAGMEVLGGDSNQNVMNRNRAFQTPLATKHAFQGWADVFLTTPADGVKDTYVTGSLPVLGGTLQAWYHDFRAERGSQQYGEEIDVGYSRPIPLVKGLVATVKYAAYDADDYSVDTDKLWAQLQYTY